MQRPPPEPKRRERGFLWWRYWLPGFAMAFVIGLALFAIAGWFGSFGLAVILGTPIAVGCTLGYGVTVDTGLKWFLGVALLAGIGVSVFTLDIAGLLCTFILALMVLAPLLLGMFFGYLLRERLKDSTFKQRQFLPVVFFLSPAALMTVEHQFTPVMPVESIVTTRVVPLPAAAAWERMAFYEEIPEQPPLLTRIGLPAPLYTEGDVNGVGDTKRCVYSSGYLVKQITQFEPGRVLAFEVIEQQGIEDRSIELTDGSFHFEDLGDGTTKITLTTRYRPLLSARTFWRPWEVALTRTLHHHVLDGIAPRD